MIRLYNKNVMQEQPFNMQPGTAPAAAQPGLPQPVAAQGQPVMAVPQPGPSAAVPSTAPAIADDGDLIEKEWVEQVKRIVAKTAHDPYLQNQQLTQLRADYLQKRYGKAVKVGD